MRTDWHALEFTRTRGWEARDRSDDELADFVGLAAWCERRGIIAASLARHYRRYAGVHPAQARAARRDAQALRALIYRVLCRAGACRPPTSEQLREVNEWLVRFTGARQLARSAGEIRWDLRLDPADPDQLLAPIVWSLAELLTAPEFSRVRRCEADDCGWLFIDASRARSRRWCTMSDCGNLAKVRAFRARQQVAG